MTLKERLDLVFGYLLLRLNESSTWRGLVVMASVVRWHQLNGSSRGEVAMQIGLFLSGLAGAALPDKIRKSNG